MKLDLLQVLRGVAALSVLARHDLFQPPTGAMVRLANGSFRWGWVGVDVFFCLSGFIMAWVHGKDIGIPARARVFALKRFFRIYPPYIIVLFITTALALLASTEGYHRKAGGITVADFLHSVVLFPPYAGLIVGVAWTLTHEVFFYVLFCGSIVVGRRPALVGVALWLLAIFVYPHPDQGTNSQLCDFAFSPVNLEFLGGVATAFLARRFEARTASWILLPASLSILAVGFAANLWRDFIADAVAANVVEKFELTVCCSALIFSLVRIEINHRLVPPRFLVLLGSASYSIYLLNFQIVHWLGHGLEYFPSILHQSALVQLFLIGVGLVAAFTGLAFYAFVERPLLQWSQGWIAREIQT